MHLVQAGASILSNGKTSSTKPSGGGLHFNGARSEPSVTCGQEEAAVFSHNLRESRGGQGGVAVLTSPASDPLSLTLSPPVGLESVMKEGALPPPSSSEWQEFWDEEVEASYYYNSATREALWVRPDGF